MLHTTSYIRQKTKKKSIPLIHDNNKSLHFLFQKNSNVLNSLRSKKSLDDPTHHDAHCADDRWRRR